MVYLFFGSGLAFVLSYVFFEITKNFKKKARLIPHDIIYKKDQYGLKQDEVVWETPKLKNWANEDIGFALFALFVARWALIGAGLFLLADFLQAVLSLPTIIPIPRVR